MADYQAITHGIRAALRAGGHAPTDELADFAAGYAMLCQEANLRLRRCSEYAARGGYAEVAHLASCQPPLDRLTAALHLPELPAWNELCAKLNLQRAPALLLDNWPEVKAAIDAELKLRPLLARHRTLAIAGACTADRLSIVRLLARHDSANPAWAEEQQRLEPLRIAELQTVLARSGGASESPEVQAALRELSEESWLTELPDDMQELVEPAKAAREAKAAAEEVAKLSARLLAADLSRRPGEETAVMVARWEALAPWPAGADPAVVDQVCKRVADWKQREQRRREAADAEVITTMFRPDTAAASTPQRRRRWRRPVLIGVVMVALVTLGYAALQARPEIGDQIRHFLLGPE